MNPPLTVLITGGSSGIGLELARCFAADGHSLVLTGRDASALEAAAQEIRAAQRVSVATFIAELGTQEGIARLIQQIGEASLAIDVLVNNAGFAVHGDFAVSDVAEQTALNTVHIDATWRLTRAFLPGMIQRRRGGVMNVGSAYSFSTAPWQALYGAAKSWTLSFSLALREELRGTGVNVTALCPGTTLTRFRTRKGTPDRASWMTLPTVEVAKAGHRGFCRGRAVVVPGIVYTVYVFAARRMPVAWLGRYVYYTAYRMRRISGTGTKPSKAL